MAWKNEQVSNSEIKYILGVARECLKTSGDFVELGCYKGDTSLMLAEILKGLGKKLWIYDSFEGLPEKREKDYSLLGENFQKGELAVSKREVKERFLKAGLKVPVIKKGWFADFEPKDLPEKIAFCFLDGDFYESIRDGLKLVEDKMSNGGVIIVHDYNNSALPGVRRAVNDWLKNRGDRVESFETILKITIKN